MCSLASRFRRPVTQAGADCEVGDDHCDRNGQGKEQGQELGGGRES